MQQWVLGARFLVFRSDGVQAATALKRVGVRGAARRQCFRLRKLIFAVGHGFFGFSDPSDLEPTVVGPIAIIFRREIRRAGTFVRSFAKSLPSCTGSPLWHRRNAIQVA